MGGRGGDEKDFSVPCVSRPGFGPLWDFLVCGLLKEGRKADLWFCHQNHLSLPGLGERHRQVDYSWESSHARPPSPWTMKGV